MRQLSLYEIGRAHLVIVILLTLLSSCKDNRRQEPPLISYDDTLSVIHFVQIDTLSKDTAIISIGDFFRKEVVIKDSVSFKIWENLKKYDDKVSLAYRLANNNNSIDVNIHLKRGVDTSFVYKFKNFELIPINVAKVISGQCVELYDINCSRDYLEKIRLWLFNNNISPDSLLIDKMNQLLRLFDYTGLKEYSMKKMNIQALKTLENQIYKFDVNLAGDYYYLYASNNIDAIVPFIKTMISKNFVDAYRDTKGAFKCSNDGMNGINVLFLISITKDWEYSILPVGIVVIDKEAPYIKIANRRNKYSFQSICGGIFNSEVLSSQEAKSNYLLIDREQVKINIPSLKNKIESYVVVQSGDFQGNNYSGYNIPFLIFYNGDLASLTIDGKTIEAKNIINNGYNKIHIKHLDIGYNSIEVIAKDKIGNISKSSIPIQVFRENPINNEYEDLEDRINELEGRIDDLER